MRLPSRSLSRRCAQQIFSPNACPNAYQTVSPNACQKYLVSSCNYTCNPNKMSIFTLTQNDLYCNMRYYSNGNIVSGVTSQYEDVLKKLPVAFKNLTLELRGKQFSHAQKRLESIRASLYSSSEHIHASVDVNKESPPKFSSDTLKVENTGKKIDASILAYQVVLTAKLEDNQGKKRLYSLLMLDRIESDSTSKVTEDLKDRDHVDFLLQMISVFESCEEYDLAIRLYKWLIKHHQKYNVTYYCRIGELYELKKHYTMAQQYYKDCLEINKNFGQAYHRLSNICEIRNQYAEALEYFAKYAAIVFEKHDQVQEEEYIHVGCKLGHLLSINRNYDTADDYFERLYSTYPYRVDILYEWIISLKRQRIDGRDTQPALEILAKTVESTIISADRPEQEMYRGLSRLHIVLELFALRQARKRPDDPEEVLDASKLWNLIEKAWSYAKTRHDQQLMIWEALNLGPKQEYHDNILQLIASNEELYTSNLPLWRRVARLLYPEPQYFTEENEKLKKNSYDIEVYLVTKPVAIISVLANSQEEAIEMAMRFAKKIHPDSSVTNIQHPSLFYNAESNLESDLFGIWDVNLG